MKCYDKGEVTPIYSNKNGVITNKDVCRMLQVSASTANRILSGLVKDGKLQKIRAGSSWAYTLP